MVNRAVRRYVRSATSRLRPLLGNLQHSFTRSHRRVPVFVLACQRSGTTMLLNILAQSPACRVFYERNQRAYDTYRLLDEHMMRRLIARSSGDAVVFKPLNDAQYADRLLETYAGSKVIWIYRGYRSVVNSAIRLWQGAQRDIMLGIARDELRHPGQGPMREGMTPDMLALCRRLCDLDISAEDGAALHWYFRNLIYFERGLDRHPGVLLVKYEDLILDPLTHLPRVFDFIGCRFSSRYVKIVQRRSADQSAASLFRPEIEELCATLMERLDSWKALGASISTISEGMGRADAPRA